jgi:hypothetical protein
VKIEEEDKMILLLASLPCSYDHMLTTLSYGKKTLELEEVTRALVNETRRNLPMIKLMGLWRDLSQSKKGISLRGRMTEISSIGLSHDRQRMKNLGQIQMMWSATIIIRNGTTEYLQGVETRFGR